MFTTNDFIPTAYSHNIEVASSSGLHQAILVKYWGKGQSNSGKSISQFYLE
jgi:hypothetical protein